jgi:hypothetical protein
MSGSTLKKDPCLSTYPKKKLFIVGRLFTSQPSISPLPILENCVKALLTIYSRLKYSRKYWMSLGCKMEIATSMRRV